MLGEKMAKALNDQLNAEAYSGYLYLAMAAYFESIGLRGSAHWMVMQAREEFFHSLKFHNYILDRGGRVLLKAIEAPPAAWDGPLHVFQEAYVHEQMVTGLINDLVDLAQEEKDHAGGVFLQWFVTEQVEEEASVDEVIQKLKLAGDAGPGLFMIDSELAQRTLSPTVQAALLGTATPQA